MYIYIIIAIVAIIVIYFLVTYNKLIALKNMVKEAFSTMDVYLKKRWDLVPNLVECVKGYAKHEQDTLEEVVKLRNEAYDSMSQKDKMETSTKIKSGINKLMMLAESYPDLKADKNFRQLSDQLIQIEEDIANSRKYYNGTVRIFIIKLKCFQVIFLLKCLDINLKQCLKQMRQKEKMLKLNFSKETNY